MSKNPDTETLFVNGDHMVGTGNIGAFSGDWRAAAWQEAQRIATGLGGAAAGATVTEIDPGGITVRDWRGDDGTHNRSTNEELQHLLVQVDGRTVAAVITGHCLNTEWDIPNPGV